MPYATVADFTAFLDPDPVPANAARLLDRASEVLDELLIGVRYDTDELGAPTDPQLVELFRKATCLQAQYVDSLKDETGSMANVSQLQMADQSITRALSVVGRGTPRVSEAVGRLLRVNGLWPVRPAVWG